MTTVTGSSSACAAVTSRGADLEELAAVGQPGERIGVSEAAELRDEPLVVALHGQLAGDDDDREPERPEHRAARAARCTSPVVSFSTSTRPTTTARYGSLLTPVARLRRLLPGAAATARRLGQRRERERREGAHPERVRQRPRSVAVRELEARVDDVGDREQHRPAGEQPQGRRPVASDPPAHQDARDAEDEDHVADGVREREHDVEETLRAAHRGVDDEVPDDHQGHEHDGREVERERQLLLRRERADGELDEPGEHEHVEREVERVGGRGERCGVADDLEVEPQALGHRPARAAEHDPTPGRPTPGGHCGIVRRPPREERADGGERDRREVAHDRPARRPVQHRPRHVHDDVADERRGDRGGRGSGHACNGGEPCAQVRAHRSPILPLRCMGRTPRWRSRPFRRRCDRLIGAWGNDLKPGDVVGGMARRRDMNVTPPGETPVVAQQLRLVEPPSRPRRRSSGSSVPRTARRARTAAPRARRAAAWGEWHLDPRTRRVGKAGVAAARRALEEAVAAAHIVESQRRAS